MSKQSDKAWTTIDDVMQELADLKEMVAELKQGLLGYEIKLPCGCKRTAKTKESAEFLSKSGVCWSCSKKDRPIIKATPEQINRANKLMGGFQIIVDEDDDGIE